MLKKLGDYSIYFAAAVGVVSTVDVSFWLMNQPDSYSFYIGLFLLTTIGFLLLNWILSLTKTNKDGDVQ